MEATRWSQATHLAGAAPAEALVCVRLVAARQGGRVSTVQAARVGCTTAVLRGLRRSGEATIRRNGVLRFAAAGDDEHARDWELVLAAGGDPTTAEVLAQRAAQPAPGEPAASPTWRDDPPGQDVALCMGTALRVLGVERARRFDRGDVLAAGSAAPKVAWATVHRTRRLDRCDITRRAGVPATTGARSLIDLSRVEVWEHVVALTDDTVCARLTARSWLHRRALALRPGRPYVQPLIDLTGPGAERLFQSWLERRGAQLAADAGLPAPRWQVAIDDDRGRIGVVDACWARGGQRDVVWELEGLRFHTTPAQRRRDNHRFNRLTRDHVVLRHTWEDVVREPARVVADLKLALDQP